MFVFCHFQIPAAQQTKSLSDHLAVCILSLEAASASLLKKGREIPWVGEPCCNSARSSKKHRLQPGKLLCYLLGHCFHCLTPWDLPFGRLSF
jgi:hypothetical protein